MILSNKELYDEVQVRARNITNREHTPGTIRRVIQHAYNHIYGWLVRVNPDHFVKTATVTLVANQQEYPLPSDFLKMRLVRRTDQTTPYTLRPASVGMRSVQTVPWPYSRYYNPTGSPSHYYVRGKVVGFIPAPESGAASAITLEYIPSAPELQSSADFQLGPEGEGQSIASIWEPLQEWRNDEVVSEGARWRIGASQDLVPSLGLDGARYFSDTNVTIREDDLLWGSRALQFYGKAQSDATHNPAASFFWGSAWSGSTVSAYNLDADAIESASVDFGATATDLVALALWCDGNAANRCRYVGVTLYSQDPYDGTSVHYAEAWIRWAEGAALRSGWNVLAWPKSGFQATGSPSWRGICGIIVNLYFYDPTIPVANLIPDDTPVTVAFGGIAVLRGAEGAAPLSGGAIVLEPNQFRGIMVSEVPEVVEWLVLESVLRLDDIEAKVRPGMELRKEDVKRNVLRLLTSRQAQSIPHIRLRNWR